MNQYTRPLIAFDEGTRQLPYQDSLGIWTIGVGHNLQANGLPAGVCADAADGLPWPDCLGFLQRRNGLNPDEISALFDVDVKDNCSWLWVKPWWPTTNEARQAALEDMAFNLGPAKMQKFVTFLGLIATGDYEAAASDLEFHTAVAAELPKRYGRLEQIIRSGSVAGILEVS